MDGVLIDSEMVYLEHIYGRIKSKHPYIQRKDIYPLVGFSVAKSKAYLSSILKGYEDIVSFEADFYNFYKGCNPDFPSILREDAKDTLAALRGKGYKLALASSTGQKGIDKVLSSCGLSEYFSVVISGEMFKESKPNPEIYLHTAALLKVKPENCLAVEDSTYGVAAAYNAGMTVAAYKDDRFSFDQSLAHYSINSLSELLIILEELNEKKKMEV